MRKLPLALCMVAIGLLRAQIPGLVPVAPPAPVFTQLKLYLNLNDAQLQSLLDNLAQRTTAQQAIYKQINQKQLQLSALLAQGTSDVLAVGQLEIDINNLRRQLPVPNSSFRDAALAVLTPDQKSKLANLVSALQLQQPASQAITLDLIDAPTQGLAPPPMPLHMSAVEPGRLAGVE